MRKTRGWARAGARTPARPSGHRRTALLTAVLASGGLATLLAAGPASAQTARPAPAPPALATANPAPGLTPSVALFTPADSGNAMAHLAYTGTDGSVWLRDALAPSQPATDLGGHLIGGPDVVLVPPGVLAPSQTSDELAVFGRGTDNALWWTHQTASGWTGWQSLGGVLTSKPGAAASEFGDHGKLVVFARGTDAEIWYTSFGNGSCETCGRRWPASCCPAPGRPPPTTTTAT